MIGAFASFFLRNEKITFILILIISVFWLLSYILLPKQYNPSIVAPAFLIEIPSYGYSAREGHEYVIQSLENKIQEIVGIDTLYGFASDGFTSLMVAFEVWVDQEVAKTRLYDKMYANYDLRPFNIEDIRIRSIDPEDLPQVSYAIVYSGSELSTKERGQYLQNIAKNLREEIKQVEWTTTIEIIGGYSNDISIELIPERIEAFWLDISETIRQVKEKSWTYTLGELIHGWKKMSIKLNHKTDTIDTLKNLIIHNDGEKKIFLQDIASIERGPIDIKNRYSVSDSTDTHDAVFIGIAKLKWTNSVHVVENIHKVVETMREKLPKNISILTIQDEWETAKEATNELMLHLFVSIAIVLVILIIFLGVRDAINAAFCIPMVLGIVFIVALILGLDINRITLFALILSLGILVDDSIVMVENNARHLAMIPRTGKSKHEAIIDSVKEVGVSIILSTITRIISFVAMFAVTGMMGDYMKPIPIFASIALTASLIVAFSINPFLASFLYRPHASGHHEKKEWRFLNWYGEKLQIFIKRDEKTTRMRKWLKIGFWISLFIIILTPIMLGIFKARMLPKADKNQIYVWVDAPRNATIEMTNSIAYDIETFLVWYKKNNQNWNTEFERILPETLRIIENVDTSVWDKFLPDFANLFRGGNNRIKENQISIRINLIPAHDRKISSESFTIQLRSLLEAVILKKYPDIRMRLLEDPPGPPTQATFHIKLKGESTTDGAWLVQFSNFIEKIVSSITKDEDIVDLTSSHSSSAPGYEIQLNHDKISTAWLTTAQVQSTIEGYFSQIPTAIARHTEWQYGASQIYLSISREAKKDLSHLNAISFLNPDGKRIRLDEIATITPTFESENIYTDGRRETIHLYGEMWENSVIYPIFHLYTIFDSSELPQSGYKKIASSPYRISFEEIATGKRYDLEWDGEWKLTMDTFRDLGLAMIFSLFVIYFIIVTQFGSFLIWGIIMTTFLLSFFGIFPGFSLLYLTSGTYFTATAMIGAIALGGIVVGNALILIDYINQLLREWKSLEYAVVVGSKKRFIPVMLTSVAAVAGSFIITSDPVWSGLAWSIIWWLSASAILTLYFIPIFYYTYLRKYHLHDTAEIQEARIIEHEKELLSYN